MRRRGAVAWLAALFLWVTFAMGDSPAHSVSAVSLFTIGKSQNKNQVQYAIHVDDQCVPMPGAPVFAYWRMLELGPSRVEPLLSRELRAYGIANQRVTARSAVGGKVHLALRAMPNRPILVETLRGRNGVCRALANITIAGKPAHLFDVYAKLNWHLGVNYLLLRGWSLDGAHILSEKLGIQ